jgi:hypothetical protein
MPRSARGYSDYRVLRRVPAIEGIIDRSEIAFTGIVSEIEWDGVVKDFQKVPRFHLQRGTI